MLTVDFDRLGVRDGARLLDMGCGGGRHAFEAWRRGATVVALDYSEAELKEVRATLGAMVEAGETPEATTSGGPEASDRGTGLPGRSEPWPERPGGEATKSGGPEASDRGTGIPGRSEPWPERPGGEATKSGGPEASDRGTGIPGRSEPWPERPGGEATKSGGGGLGGAVNGDALVLPFPDATFDCIIASEVLEHLWADTIAIAELVRVLRPGGRIAVTVPTRWPERVCWALDHRYHDTPGGHVRIYRQPELEAKLEAAGLWLRGSHHAHALHSPYWWLKCATGVNRTDPPRAVRRYHDFLAWQITNRPAWVESLDRLLNPVLGKSLVVYGQKLASDSQSGAGYPGTERARPEIGVNT